MDLAKAFGVNTFTRTLARLYETLAIFPEIMNWVENLDLNKPYCKPFPDVSNGKGFGLAEAPRGGVGHWINVENNMVKTYQIITPTTWNLGPMDSKGQYGACEQALIGAQLKNKESVIEAAHIVRSFDPCISCSIHAIGNIKKKIYIEASG
jgi:hydrogenase large subunit